MPAPIIGITTHRADLPFRAELDSLLDKIVAAVICAGGFPLTIPPGLKPSRLRELYERIDGLLFSGGGDVDPTLYRAAMPDCIEGIDVTRDFTELQLSCRLAQDPHPKPFLGICRGMQIFNVALGGTLYTDVSEHPGALRHNCPVAEGGAPGHHIVCIESGSLLDRIAGTAVLAVNSLHHQACKDIAPPLKVTARAEDGLAEAVELDSHPFALCVQWHPECLTQISEHRRLFEALVAASS
jgi:putative glutamine amidotransferase